MAPANPPTCDAGPRCDSGHNALLREHVKKADLGDIPPREVQGGSMDFNGQIEACVTAYNRARYTVVRDSK